MLIGLGGQTVWSVNLSSQLEIRSTTIMFSSNSSSAITQKFSELSLKKAFGASHVQVTNDPNRPVFLHQTGDRICQISDVFALSNEDREEGDTGSKRNIYTRRNMFAVFNRNGTVTVWTFSPVPRAMKCMTVNTGVNGITSGTLLLNDKDRSKCLLLLQSNEKGIQMFQFTYTGEVGTESLINSPTLDIELHVGFCTLKNNLRILAFPIHQYSFGVLSFKMLAENILVGKVKTVVPEIKCGGSTMLMFLKLITYGGRDYVISGNEKGQVRVHEIKGSVSEGNADFDAWTTRVFLKDCSFDQSSNSSQSLGYGSNKLFSENEDFMIPLCAEFKKETCDAIVGTNSKLIFLFKLDFETQQIRFDGKRSLVQKGVNDMSLHPDGKLLALGGWDGLIRILLVPFLKQITSIKFHESSINSLVFLTNYDGEDNSKHYLLVGADDGQISCWNIDEKLSLNNDGSDAES